MYILDFQDPIAWLAPAVLHANGHYESALSGYAAFLSSLSSPLACEWAKAARLWVVQSIAQCYAAVADWQGLDSFTTDQQRVADKDPAHNAWWGKARNEMHRFFAYAAYDGSTGVGGGAAGTGGAATLGNSQVRKGKVQHGVYLSSTPSKEAGKHRTTLFCLLMKRAARCLTL